MKPAPLPSSLGALSAPPSKTLPYLQACVLLGLCLGHPFPTELGIPKGLIRASRPGRREAGRMDARGEGAGQEGEGEREREKCRGCSGGGGGSSGSGDGGGGGAPTRYSLRAPPSSRGESLR